MKFGDIDITVKDYPFRMGPGIVAILSVVYKTKIHECAYWYTNEHQVLEMDPTISNDLGDIRKYEHYDKIMEHLKSITPKYEEIVDNLSEINEVYKQKEGLTQSSSGS